LSKKLLLKVCKLQMMDNYSVILLTEALSHLCSWLHALIFLISCLQDKKHRLYVVGKDSPHDLADLVPSDIPISAEQPDENVTPTNVTHQNNAPKETCMLLFIP
jgi:hypothetical protein